jgi:hypothetical protein
LFDAQNIFCSFKIFHLYHYMRITSKNAMKKDILRILNITVIILCLLSCAGPSFYTINLRYMPQNRVLRAGSNLQKFTITVAAFKDVRTVKNNLVIGERVTGKTEDIMALSGGGEPSTAVAAIIRELLVNAGYTVNPDIPSWDLDECSIDQPWGSLLIGGLIEELSVVCRTDLPTITCNANVKLRVRFADVQKHRILSTLTLSSSSSLQHVSFSEKQMQQQINSALSAAIEKLIENNNLDNRLLEAARVRSESLTD